ncbi:MAG: histidine kinase [Chitinophagaceae bacterium]|nr:histidine kinase [Chitinophagaceae bacterium]
MILVLQASFGAGKSYCQANSSNPSVQKIQKASKKVKEGFSKKDEKIAAEGFYDLGEEYYNKGDLKKSEEYYNKAKDLYAREKNDDGIAKSSRGLAKVQEELNKKDEAAKNYKEAEKSSLKTGDSNAIRLNSNDLKRLQKDRSYFTQEKDLTDNISLNLKFKDTVELISNYNKLGNLGLQTNQPSAAIYNFSNAYQVSKTIPLQARSFNQKITDLYVQNKDFDKAIETKKELLNEPFVKNSRETKANETNQLATIYLQKKETVTAVDLLKESYNISIKNGHTLEAKRSIEKLDSIYRIEGKKDLSLALYKQFLMLLPELVGKDSSLVDNKIIQETEEKLKTLQEEKALKDDLIKRKNRFNYWLIGSLLTLISFMGVILFLLKKSRIKNKQIALQSLRREMNPHFIFNSLNSINQFIANNNELAANQYLTKFSTLMRRVMENSKDDFVLFSKETELLQNYLDLEKSRFTDKFDFKIEIDDNLFANEHLFIPGMLIQPHLENAIWHGLRYKEDKGFLHVHFTQVGATLQVLIEDNGAGIAESKKTKTVNQQKQKGRGISNTLERIKILNELYHHNITCVVEDKAMPNHGVKVTLNIPLINKLSHEN